MTKRSAKRTEFLNDLLVDAIEGGMTSYWAGFVEIDRDEDLNILNVTLFAKDEYEKVENRVIETIDYDEWRNFDWEKQEPMLVAAGLIIHKATIETMAKGLALHRAEPQFAEQGMGGRGLTLADRTNGDDGDYDAIDADCILQLGVLGKVIYG